MINLDEFRSYLTINKGALDDEVTQQPSLFFEVTEALAEANATRDQLKEELDQIGAEIGSEVRKTLDPKALETRIKALVKLDPDYQKAFTGWLKAKMLSDKLEGLKEAFKQRSYALRSLTDLYNANYFETSSLRPTPSQERAVYETRRARLAAGREAKVK